LMDKATYTQPRSRLCHNASSLWNLVTKLINLRRHTHTQRKTPHPTQLQCNNGLSDKQGKLFHYSVHPPAPTPLPESKEPETNHIVQSSCKALGRQWQE
jgi:hypothetical protein